MDSFVQSGIDKILPKSNSYNVVCFGGEDWWYHNRGHIDMQLMRRFAKRGTTLYVNSIVMQKPNVREGKRFVQKLVRKAKSIFAGLKKSDAGFWVYSPFSIPLHHISWARKLNEWLLHFQISWMKRKLKMKRLIVWVACPAACDVALKMRKHKLVYQRTDRFEEFPNVDNETIKKYDRRLKAEADLTIFVNNTLYDEESSQCKKAIYLDHGVDFEMFASAENREEMPTEMAAIKKPIVGFFGGIDKHTSDIRLIEKVVVLLPNMSFVFVGKASVDCIGLLSRRNVWMLGQRPYEQIPHYGKCFDVTIMPWRQNRWIKVCNPIKLKEYLALGKPIVSTSFTELQKYLDVVYEAKSPEEFARCIEKALTEDNPERIAVRRKKVQETTWDSKAKLVLDELFNQEEAVVEVNTSEYPSKIRICLAASAGGHASQLLKLAESWHGYDTFCITTTEAVRNKLQKYGKVYVVGECNRQHPLRVLQVLLRCLKVIFHQKPDVVISTGAAPGCIVCFLGKLLGSKVIWIDSITNVERPSLSGRMVRYIADLLLVQWPELAEQYNNVEYVGELI